MRKLKVLLSTLLLAVTTLAFAQDITVKGVVTDASNGEPLSGAAILVKGTPKGVVADENGRYTVTVSANGTLGFTTIGFKDLEVAVEGRSEINVKLEPDSEMLDETIVIAYGTTTKTSFTGSASQVKSDAIEAHVASSVESALAGTASGVQVLTTSGDPASSGIAINIRGFGSMSASNSPLVVVDGTPYDGSISDINPNDVESMSVLKDASASAIYGARGANGVIMITTKRAKNQDAQVKFDGKWGSNSRLIPQYDVITDPGQYYETHYRSMYNSKYFTGSSAAEAYAHANANLFDEKNGGLGYQVFTVPEGQNLIGNNFKINPNAKLGYFDGVYYYTPDDWYNEVYHNSFRQEYNVSISGSTNKFNYYASAGYLDDGGIVNNSGYKRFTAHVNADYQAKKWLDIVTNMNFSHSDSQTPSYSSTWGSTTNLFYITNHIGPIYPLYVRKLDANGNPYILKDGDRTVYDSNNTNMLRPSLMGNAVQDNELNSKKESVDQFNGKWGVVVTPVEGLSLSANAAILARNSRYNGLYSRYGSASSVDGQVDVSSDRFFSLNWQAIAEYKTDFNGSKHNFDILAGWEQYKYTSQGLEGVNDHLFDPYIAELNNADGTDKKLVYSSSTAYKTMGFLSRVQYDYAGRYFISGSYRKDASSRFYTGHQWGDFGSVGAAWVISNESFMANVSNVDLLKLKVSYGVQGNDNLGSNNFPYSDQYSHSYNSETNSYSLSLAYKGNKELTWETSKSINAGVEFGFWGGKLNGSIEYFDRTTADLLYAKDVPVSSGNPTGYMPVNIGSIRNNGVEIDLNGNIFRTSNVEWNWNLNLSSYKNIIVSLDESVAETGIKGSNYIYKVGGSLYDMYMYRYAGLDSQGAPLFYKKVLDAKGNWDGQSLTTTTTFPSSAEGQFELGSVLPKVFGGFGTTLRAYGFDLTCQLSFQLGGKYYDGTYQTFMHTESSSAGQAWHKDALNAWTPENQNTNIPRLGSMNVIGQSAVDYFLISSNYLSLNNLTLGYSFPKKWLDKTKFISGLRIYFAGENLAVASARKGVDPRYSYGLGSYTSGSGKNSNGYAATRSLTGGITLTF